MWSAIAERFAGKDPQSLQAAAACAAVAVAAAILGRWMPRGVGMALALAALVAALLQVPPESAIPLTAGLLALAGGLAAGVVLRSPDTTSEARRLTRREQAALLVHAAGLLVIWPLIVLLALPPIASEWPLEYALAAALACAALWAQQDDDRTVGVPVTIALLLWIAVRGWAMRSTPAAAYEMGMAWIGLLLALASLGAILLAVHAGWEFRRRHWLTAPERLLDETPASPVLFGMAVAFGIAALLAAALGRSHPVSPLVVFLAGLAVCSTGHLNKRDAFAGPGGLLMLGGAWVFAAWAWIPATAMNTVIGAAIGSAFLLWLSQFWCQQLLNNQAWTTAGRLIGVAREQAQFSTAAVLAAVMYARQTVVNSSAAPLWSLVLALLTLLLLLRVHARDARALQSSRGALAAGAAGLALAGVLDLLVHQFWSGADPALSVAVVAVVLSLRLTRVVEESAYATACNAYLGAVLPGVLLIRALLDPETARAPLAWVGLVIVLAAATLRWARTRPRSEILAPA